MKNILSRLFIFTAIQGLTEYEKDLIPLIKNQGLHSYCWAYSITSAIELKYALQTGNRLKFSPFGIIDNVLDFYDANKDNPDYSQAYDICKNFSSENENEPKELYVPECALLYLKEDKKRMIYEYNNKSSNVILSNYSNIKIESLNDLIQNLKNNKVILAQYFSGLMGYYVNKSIIDYYVVHDELPIDHNIIITGVGTLEDIPGLYVEIVNSWGLEVTFPNNGQTSKVGYDGLYYVKIADNETSPLVNNMGLFTLNYVIDVDELESIPDSDTDSNNVSKSYKTATIILSILTGVFFCLFILFLVLYLCTKKESDSDRQASRSQFTP